MEKTLGRRISSLLIEKNLTQKEFAKQTNLNEVTVGRYINDKREPTASVLKTIADVLDVSTDYLTGKSTDPKLSRKDELDIAKEIAKINESLENTNELMFHGEILDEETRELLKKSLENTIYFSKILAKEKFNPNKNKIEDND